jgi:hypothetical protein
VLEIFERLPVVKAVCGLPGVLPHGCVPVAVVFRSRPDTVKPDESRIQNDSVLAGVEWLYAYKHPVNAFYVFSAGNGELPESLRRWCREAVYVPAKASSCGSQSCLASAVNTLLYDRRTKEIFHERGK